MQSLEATAQHTKKSKITDGIGLLAGVNVILFYPKDVNNSPIHGGDPKLLPGDMFGLSYYHDFSPRWAHIFQLRVSDHQIKYWKTTSRYWFYNHENVMVQSDSGDYHLKYRFVSMNYMTGWCLNRQVGWHIYGGIQINYTIVNHSTKTVDRIEYGKIEHNEFIPFVQPDYYYNETSKTYAPDAEAEVLLRTDVRIKMSKQWTIRPVLEYAFDPGLAQEPTQERLAFYLEVYHAL